MDIDLIVKSNEEYNIRLPEWCLTCRSLLGLWSIRHTHKITADFTAITITYLVWYQTPAWSIALPINKVTWMKLYVRYIYMHHISQYIVPYQEGEECSPQAATWWFSPTCLYSADYESLVKQMHINSNYFFKIHYVFTIKVWDFPVDTCLSWKQSGSFSTLSVSWRSAIWRYGESTGSICYHAWYPHLRR